MPPLLKKKTIRTRVRQRRDAQARDIPNRGLWEEYQDAFHPFELRETVAVLSQAVEANEYQISELSRAISQNVKDLSVLIEKQGTQTHARIDSIQTAFQASQRPNYMLWVAVLGVFLTFVLMIGKVIDLQTKVTMAPITEKATVSERDRGEIHQEILQSKAEVIHNKSDIRDLFSKFVEVETQFRMSDKNHNIQFAEQQRMNNILMQLAQGAGREPPLVYPSGPYYFPETAKEDGRAPVYFDDTQ